MKRSFVVACMMLAAVTACSSDKEKKPERLCPQAAIVRDLERIRDYGSETPDENALVATALMTGVQDRCDYRDEGVDVNFELKMAAGKEARLGGDHVSFPFFIAVINPEHEILSKELMTADFRFRGDSKIADRSEPLHVFIPLAKDADASYYQVLVGFQLTEDQLKAARKAVDEPVR